MKSKLSIAFLWAVIFILGGIAGWFGQCIYRDGCATTATTDQKAKKDPKNAKEQKDKDQDLQQISADWARKLQLDAGQQESLKTIFLESRMKYRELNKEFRPRYEMIRNESDDRIREMLRDSQRQQFEELLKPFHPQQPATK